MIVGIGTDIVSIARIESIRARFGDRFVHRVLTESERAVFRSCANPGGFLARRFAAKEAAAKALGTGIRAPFTFDAMEVRRRDGERPELHFLAEAENAAREQGVARALLSISDERDYAVAFVVLLSA